MILWNAIPLQGFYFWRTCHSHFNQAKMVWKSWRLPTSAVKWLHCPSFKLQDTNVKLYCMVPEQTLGRSGGRTGGADIKHGAAASMRTVLFQQRCQPQVKESRKGRPLLIFDHLSKSQLLIAYFKSLSQRTPWERLLSGLDRNICKY